MVQRYRLVGIMCTILVMAVFFLTSHIISRMPFDQRIVSFDVSPGTKQIVFVGNGYGKTDLYVLDTKKKVVKRVTNSELTEKSPTFSCDGKYIAYSASNAGSNIDHLYMMSADGKIKRQLTNAENASDYAPSFSRDGTKIVFNRATRLRQGGFGGAIWDDFDIYTINIDGSKLIRQTYGRYYSIYPPRYSPINNDILSSFITHGTHLREFIYVIDRYGKQTLVSGGTNETNSWPTYSPDGKQILFVTDRSQNSNPSYGIGLMNADGSHFSVLPIFMADTHTKLPRYWANGRQILFLSEGGSGYNLQMSLMVFNLGENKTHHVAPPELFCDPLSSHSARID